MRSFLLGIWVLFAAACGPECEEGGETYGVGETWTCSDGCNTCECIEDEDGETYVESTDLGCFR